MRTFFEKKIQTLLNRFLALDAESSDRLKALHNHSITIELNGIGWIFQLLFVDGKVLLQTENITKSDTTIKGTPLSLLSMALTKEAGDRKKFFSTNVTIEGNIEIGQQVIELFDALEWDWEEDLSRFVGDVPAHHIGRAAKNAKQFTTKLKNTFVKNINEYTHEEIHLFPSSEALQDFFSDVDALRMDTDRLEAKIIMLTKKIANRGL